MCKWRLVDLTWNAVLYQDSKTSRELEMNQDTLPSASYAIHHDNKSFRNKTVRMSFYKSFRNKTVRMSFYKSFRNKTVRMSFYLTSKTKLSVFRGW